MTAKQTYDCWCVFNPDGVPKWYTCRTTPELSKHVYEEATGQVWANAARRGYTVRRMRMTEVK